MKKIILISVIALIVAGAVFGVIMAKKTKELDKFMDDLILEEVDLSHLKDGTYFGEANAGIIVVLVSVEIKDNQIEHVEIVKHKNGKGDAADIIVKSIEQEDKILVDAVSGATLSSNVIKKAVQNALENSN